VGYGDVVPTTTGSRVFSVIVVIVGFAVFSLVTASISALMVGRQERRLEHEILRDIHHQVRLLRQDIDQLRQDQQAGGGARTPPPGA
jgi:voltage-gated potassium channel